MIIQKIFAIFCISIICSFSAIVESVCFYRGTGVGPVGAEKLFESLKEAFLQLFSLNKETNSDSEIKKHELLSRDLLRRLLKQGNFRIK